MDAYTSFAQVYDLFMDNVPYDEWCAYICEILKSMELQTPVLDLGCGTGELTRRLAACGYDMTGVDVSVDMLAESHGKADRSADSLSAAGDADTRTGWMCGQSAVPVTVSIVCLSHRNFPMHSGGLPPVWESGGVFIFDMNTAYKYEQLLGDHTFAESRQEGSFIWENYYDEETRINEYDLTLFIPEAESCTADMRKHTIREIIRWNR